MLAAFAAAVGLYVYDYRGPLETVRGTVVDTREYPHTGAGGPPHTHTEAVIEYENARHTLSRADGLTTGQTVWVDVRRGRLSGRLRFVSLRQTAPGAEHPGRLDPARALD